jgi:hypothetical protein
MFGLLIVFTLLGIGFAAGYATCAIKSRKHLVEYLKYEPYLAPSRRPRVQTGEPASTTNASAMKRNVSKAPGITQSFQETHIGTHRAARTNLQIVPDRTDTNPGAKPAAKLSTIDHRLEELIRRLGQKN